MKWLTAIIGIALIVVGVVTSSNADGSFSNATALCQSSYSSGTYDNSSYLICLDSANKSNEQKKNIELGSYIIGGVLIIISARQILKDKRINM